MPTYMEIGILFVHIESITITVFGIEVNGIGKLRVQMLFEILADSLNKRFSVFSQLIAFAIRQPLFPRISGYVFHVDSLVAPSVCENHR